MKTFKEYFEDQDLEQKETKEFTATFGRFNPPTIGHEKLLNKVEEFAGGGEFKIFVSQPHQDKKDPEDQLFKDPIPYDDKVKFMKAMCEKCALREIWGYNYKQQKGYKKWIKN